MSMPRGVVPFQWMTNANCMEQDTSRSNAVIAITNAWEWDPVAMQISKKIGILPPGVPWS